MGLDREILNKIENDAAEYGKETNYSRGLWADSTITVQRFNDAIDRGVSKFYSN